MFDPLSSIFYLQSSLCSALLNDLAVGRDRRRRHALQIRVAVELHVVQAKITALAERQAPLTVRGNAPANIRQHIHAVAPGALNLPNMALDVADAIDAIGNIYRAVLKDQDRFAGE